MSYKYYFFDDQQVGAEDLNKLVKMFTSAGIEDSFENGVPYSLTKLNDTVTANATSGIVPKSNTTLAVSCADGVVYIEPGVAFFDDGTVIEIESRETLTPLENAEFYVYLKSDAFLNKAYPELSDTLPEGNIVPLAKVSETGEITDLRTFAKGKVPSFYASDAGVFIEKNFTLTDGNEYLSGENRLTLIDSGNNYRYLVLICKKNSDYNELGHTWSGLVFYDTQTDLCYQFCRRYNSDYIDNYSAITKGTSFIVLDTFQGQATYMISGQLHLDDGKTELSLVSSHRNSTQSILDKFILPLEIKVLAF